MEDANLIATLIPADNNKRAENAFCLEINKDRYLPPTRGIAEGPTISSREATPAGLEEREDEHCKYNSTHCLQLTFGEAPKDFARGYSFGTNLQKCDVLLGPRGAHGISALHFGITFYIASDGKTRLLLKDSSTNGMAVSYNGQASKEVRHHFTWILNLEKEKGKWEVEVLVQGLRFKVILASHKTCKAEYDNNVKEFLEESLPSLSVLGIDSHTTTAQPSQPLTPRQLPIYIYEGRLGSGSFGQVDRVIDVSTGAIYARKEFFEPQWRQGEERRKQQKEDWLNRIRREIHIMRGNPHVSISPLQVGRNLTVVKENIVQVVDFREDPLPFLVMPYFPLGNLEDLESESSIAVEETVDLFFQALHALRYLHSRGVAHRDLKPENILVESRSPLSIRLADFGIASDKPDLETFCGTKLYLAPEVYLQSKYTASVDLWSLGVIMLQYAYGLPSAPRREERGLAWCRRVVDSANDWDSDDLIDLLTTGMLRDEPRRAAFRKCLLDGRTAAQAMVGDDDDGSTTILLRAFWDVEGESLIHDGSNRTRRCTPDHASAILDSSGLQAPSSPSNRNGHDLHLGSFKTGFKHPGSSVYKPVDHSGSHGTGSESLGGCKRQRSSSREPDDRRPPEDRLTQIPVSRTDTISDQRVAHQGESNQLCTTYDAVLALLMELLGSHSPDVDIDDRTNTRIVELSDYLAQLKITGMKLTRNNLSGQTIVATGLDCGEIVLASLTPSELTSPIGDLAAHLLHMVQFRTLSPKSTSPAAKDDSPRRASIGTDDNRFKS
ncbi:hypothetical protein MMC17_005971 [Xylographa soralifera]|nr:hypothetical protein [Xylographa soralifera]